MTVKELLERFKDSYPETEVCIKNRTGDPVMVTGIRMERERFLGKTVEVYVIDSAYDGY